MMKQYKDTAIAFGISLFVMISCTGRKTGETQKTEEHLPENVVEIREDQKKVAGVETGLFEKRVLSGMLHVNGVVSVAPQNRATVCMPYGGFVKQILLMPGRVVKKGETLAVIENQEFIDLQQNYLEAKNKFEFAEAEYKRHGELYKDAVYSEKNMQQVAADYKSLKAQVAALGQKLELVGIHPGQLQENTISRSVSVVAPIAGFVTSVYVTLGKFVLPTDVLFEIVNGDQLFLELTLFEKDANRVVKGQKIRFFVNNEKEQHEAVIYETGQSIHSDKTYKFLARVSGACRNLLPGMYVNALMETGGRELTAVPSEAVVNFDNKDYLFLFQRDKKEGTSFYTEYRMLEIQKGITDGGYTEILLPEGVDIKTARVVVKGAYHLLSAKKNSGEMGCEG